MGWPLRHRQRRTVAAQPLAPQPRRGDAGAGGEADQGRCRFVGHFVSVPLTRRKLAFTAARTALEKAVQTLGNHWDPTGSYGGGDG